MYDLVTLAINKSTKQVSDLLQIELSSPLYFYKTCYQHAKRTFVLLYKAACSLIIEEKLSQQNNN